MSKKKAKSLLSPKTKKIIVNYIGGLGYYIFLFGLSMLFILLSLDIFKYIIKDGVLYQLNFANSPYVSDGSRGLFAPVAILLSTILIVILNIFLVILPYFIGKYMKKVLEWIIENASLAKSTSSIIKIKILASCLLFFITSISIFKFDQTAIYNTPSYIIYVCSLSSIVVFLIQHYLAIKFKFKYSDIN